MIPKSKAIETAGDPPAVGPCRRARRAGRSRSRGSRRAPTPTLLISRRTVRRVRDLQRRRTAVAARRTTAIHHSSDRGYLVTLMPATRSARAPTQRAPRSISSSPAAIAVEHREVLGAADVPERDERVSPEPARVVARDVEPRRRRRRARVRPASSQPTRSTWPASGLSAGAPLLDAAVPGAHVLADVAAVHLRAERRRGTASGIAAGACVQYERHFVASSVPGSSSAPVGHASMQRRHAPQSASSGGVGVELDGR